MNVTWQGETMLLRPAKATDRGFIYTTWMRSYRQTQHLVEYASYCHGQRRRIDRLVALTVIACRESEPDAIHGWLCGCMGLLHYVYVPIELRGKGLAQTLVRAVCGEQLDFTHRWPFDTLPRGWSPNEYRLEEAA